MRRVAQFSSNSNKQYPVSAPPNSNTFDINDQSRLGLPQPIEQFRIPTVSNHFPRANADCESDDDDDFVQHIRKRTKRLYVWRFQTVNNRKQMISVCTETGCESHYGAYI